MSEDFYENDEPAEKIRLAFARGDKQVTGARCPCGLTFWDYEVDGPVFDDEGRRLLRFWPRSPEVLALMELHARSCFTERRRTSEAES